MINITIGLLKKFKVFGIVLIGIISTLFVAFIIFEVDANAVYQSYLNVNVYRNTLNEKDIVANPEDVIVDQSDYVFCMPFSTSCASVSEMGYRAGNSAGNLHYSDDIDGGDNGKAVVYAVHSGIVTYVGNDDSVDTGYNVKTYNENTQIECHYMHLYKKPDLEVGETLEIGEPFALMGDTGMSDGAHIHVEIGWHYATGVIRYYSILQLAYKALPIDEAEFWTKDPYGHYLGDGTPYLQDDWGSPSGNNKALGSDLYSGDVGYYFVGTGNWPQDFYKE